MDASLAIDALLGAPPRKARALRFLGVCNARGIVLIVPPTFSSEADTAARQIIACGHLPAATAPLVFAALDALPLDVALDAAELEAVRKRARQIADELCLGSVYDATYAALAEARGCQFWTTNAKFADAAKRLREQNDGKMAPTLFNVRFVGDF